MRLSNNIIDYVIKEVAGERAIELVSYLKNKKNISEFKIADVLKKDIKEIRTTLYLLVNHNVVSSIRKKDKKKGWYIYYWTLNTDQIKYLFKNLKVKKLETLKERLEREKSSLFFVCENKCIRLNFDQAIEFEFKCPECGLLMNQENNKEIIEGLEKEKILLEKHT
ncbi:hypothetical protein KY313_00520 [Candidatus Woesearchaeota archaeon]|jgi:transcription initiation factor TFIIE subunit alpha|nr:hypothetical protein [Candidatus Woesearchaeota archaeon]